MSERQGPPERSRFRHWRREPLRYLDMDAQGHVNNLAIGAIAENTRAMFMQEVVVPLLAQTDFMMVAVKVVLELHQELNYPGEVDVGTAFERIGNSSISIMQGVFGSDGCAATVTVTLVLIDKDKRKPAPWPASIRAALERWL
jgi:acyl-CoA thioester hydrolase